MKNVFFALIAIAILALSSCASQRKTLAQRCAESFPPRDTTIYVEVQKTDTLIIPGYDQIDTFTVECPPGAIDTIKQTITRIVRVPGKSIPIKLTFRDTITAPLDSAIRMANNELKAQLAALKRDNDIAAAKLSESRRKSGNWLPWLIVGILVAFVLWLTFKKKR